MKRGGRDFLKGSYRKERKEMLKKKTEQIEAYHSLEEKPEKKPEFLCSLFDFENYKFDCLSSEKSLNY